MEYTYPISQRGYAMKFLPTITTAATAASLALSAWVYTGATTEAQAWSLSSFFSRGTYNTPTRVIGSTMYYYDARTARWAGAYGDARRTTRLGTTPQSAYSLQRTLGYNQAGRDLNGNLVYGQRK